MEKKGENDCVLHIFPISAPFSITKGKKLTTPSQDAFAAGLFTHRTPVLRGKPYRRHRA